MRPGRTARYVTPIVLLLALGQAGAAQTKLTLEQAVAIALERNPLRKAAWFDERAAASGVKQARAAFLPRIGVSEIYQDGNDPVFVFGGKLRQQRFTTADFALNRLNTPTPFSNFVTRFSGGWQLFDSGASLFRFRQAKSMENLAGRRLERTEQELVMRVVDAYAGLLLAIKQQELAEEAVKTAQSIVDSTRDKVSAGLVVESDLLSAQVNHAARQQELIRAQNAVALARVQLNRDLGADMDTPYEPAELLAERAFPTATPEVLEKLASERRPDLRAARLQEAIQQDGVNAAKAAFGPRLNVAADWETDNPRFTGGGGNNWTVGLELQLDVFNGGEKLARLRQETALQRKAEQLSQWASSGVRLQVRKAYLDLDSARRQVEVARSAVGQAAESLRIGGNRYESGLSTITELLRMQEAHLRAQTDYWQAVYRLRTSYANLELATGTLDANSPVVKQ